MMKKIRVRVRLKIYPVLWSIMIIAAIYLMLRFAMITFTEEMGQAGFMNALSAKLCINLVETGSPLLKYSADEDGELYAFPMNLFNNSLALGEFIENDTAVTVNAKDVVNEGNGFHTFNDGSSWKVDNNSTDNDSPDEKESDKDETDTKNLASDDTSNNTSSDDTSENQSSGIISLFSIHSDQISAEYLLTNGAVIKSSQTGELIGAGEYYSEQLKVNYEESDLHDEDAEKGAAQAEGNAVETVSTDSRASYTLEKLKDVNYLIKTFYVVHASTSIDKDLFNTEELLSKDMTIKQNNEKPQILIYHTHSQEAFADSKTGNVDDTVVGVGSYLMKVLEEDYGYNVIHDESTYDIVNGSLDRNVAYSQAEDGISKILEKNPSIEVIIDLHRDSGNARTIMIDGKKAAQVMLFNGLSRDQNGPITYLNNPNLKNNLAFSLKLQLESISEYPGFFKKNFLKSYRYNLHLRPKSLLIELGTVNNTVEEAKNAMPPFAKILDKVLKGETEEE
jgi:stage II sporulation protein P